MGKSTNSMLRRNVKYINATSILDLKVLMEHCIFNQIPTLSKLAVFEVILRTLYSKIY